MWGRISYLNVSKIDEGGWKSFPHVLSWDRTDWRLVSDGWVAILLLLLLLSIASIALVDGWVGILLLQLNE